MGARFILPVMAFLGLSYALLAEARPDAVDLLRIAEAFRLARAVGATVWPGWDTAPFPLLLVGTDREFLVANPSVPAGFTSVGYSAILQTEIWSRPRRFDSGLLATLPAFGIPPVIVIGRAEITKKPSAAWVLTALHEHFHQFQMADSHYFSDVEQLGLSGGDQTGMWMLNYPFPYQSTEVGAAFSALSRELVEMLRGSSRPDRQRFWEAYTKFLEGLSERDRRYLSFQVWQEGVARYIELRVAEIGADRYSSSIEFQNLPDVQPLSAVAAGMRAAIVRELANPDLQKNQRVSFYAFGAGLALLLDQDTDTWKGRYMTEKFFLERYVGR